jgi:2-oxoglutarate ferredoxin oxidoreductase subunit alpha
VRGTSYEHNEHGNTIEDAFWTKRMNDKRLRKEKYIAQEVKKLNPATIYGKGKNLILGWGSTKGAIIDSLPSLKDFRFLQLSYISPFPEKLVKKEIERSKKVILVENNATGLLGDVIAEKTGYLIKNKILKYDARPFLSNIIIDEVKKIMRKK